MLKSKPSKKVVEEEPEVRWRVDAGEDGQRRLCRERGL